MRVNSRLTEIVREMFNLMYAARGVGLAANQVGLPLRLFVMNAAGKQGEGQERVFINPVISRPKGNAIAQEGCLSLPDLEAEVRRPAQVCISAFDLQGNEIGETLEGFDARIVQHEIDHLDGILFTDRVSPAVAMDIQPALLEFVDAFENQHAPDIDKFIAEAKEQLLMLEKEFC